MAKLDIWCGDNLDFLHKIKSKSTDLIYIDPPFNTGKQQERTQIKTVACQDGDRVGFSGKRYKTIRMGTLGYADIFTDYIEYLEPRLVQAHRILSDEGSLFFHIDCRESHYCKVLLDMIFGRESFMNEIIWCYDYGARSRKKWPSKHDNIFWYAKNPKKYIYNYENMDRIPYMAPGLVGKEKAALGKTPTDVWWQTIVSPNGKEKTGYATQKPIRILERIIKVHSNPDSKLGDFFAGSGSFGAAALACERDCFLIDKNPAALEVMKKRFAGENIQWHRKYKKKVKLTQKIATAEIANETSIVNVTEIATDGIDTGLSIKKVRKTIKKTQVKKVSDKIV